MRILVLSAYPIERRALTKISENVAGSDNVVSAKDFDDLSQQGDGDASSGKFDLAILAAAVAEQDLTAFAADAVARLRGCAVVIFSMPLHGIHQVMDCKAAGARGFILKTASETIILNALRIVAEGADYFPTEFGNVYGIQSGEGGGFAEASATLTSRQLTALQLVAAGLSNEEIAAELDMSLATIKAEIQKTCSALDARNRTHVVVRALNRRLIKFPE